MKSENSKFNSAAKNKEFFEELKTSQLDDQTPYPGPNFNDQYETNFEGYVLSHQNQEGATIENQDLDHDEVGTEQIELNFDSENYG